MAITRPSTDTSIEDVLISVEIRMGGRPMKALHASSQVVGTSAELDALREAIIARLSAEIGADW